MIVLNQFWLRVKTQLLKSWKHSRKTSQPFTGIIETSHQHPCEPLILELT